LSFSIQLILTTVVCQRLFYGYNQLFFRFFAQQWPIIGSLLFGKKRFKKLMREIPKITSRMLSKELKDLEVNGMITRNVYDSMPVMVEYQLTKSGESFRNVLDVMVDWGTISFGKKHKIAEVVEV
jgi:DNA-binding HxlR family transcriptional regulator